MKCRPSAKTSYPKIASLSYKMQFGKHRGLTIETIIDIDPGYILWMHDEKIALIDDTVLSYAEEADTDQRLSEALDSEFRGMRFFDFMDD